MKSPKSIFRSVKFRLTFWYAFVLTVLLAAFAVFMQSELRRALNRDVDNGLYYEAKMVADSFLDYLDSGGQLEKLNQMGKLPSFSGIYSVQQREWMEKNVLAWEKENQRVHRSRRMLRIVGSENTVFATNLKGWQREVIIPDFERDSLFMEKGQAYQTIYFQHKPIRLYYHMVFSAGQPLFILQSGQSMEDIESTMHRLGLIILIAIPGLVGAACFAGWILAKRSFAPMDSMISKSRDITAAYLQERLPRTLTGDELDRLAETLNQMMDRIESSTRSIQDFSSDISHELKTPLAIIRGEIEVALRKSRSAEEHSQTLSSIGEEVNELIRLVDDLMILVRSDAKQLQFVKIKVSLKDILMSVFERYTQRAGDKGIELRLEINDDVEIEGDAVYLKRVFSNLVDNAIKFTPKHGVIRLCLTSSPGEAVAEVADNGSGMDSAVQQKVFARFYRTDQARSHEGAGLGLNIAKAIVEAHKGTIDIKSIPNQGTRLILRFPISAN